MDKQRFPEPPVEDAGPGRAGRPDYISVVIEWGDAPGTSGAPLERMADGETGKQALESSGTKLDLRTGQPTSSSGGPIDRAGARETSPGSEWDIVDEASLESFPASDPPAWGSYHAAPSDDTARESEPQVQASPAPPWLAIGAAAIAAAGLGALWLGRVRRRRRQAC